MNGSTPVPRRGAFNSSLTITNDQNPEFKLAIPQSCNRGIQRADEPGFDDSVSIQSLSRTSSKMHIIPPNLEGSFADDHDALPSRHSRRAPIYPLIHRLRKRLFSIFRTLRIPLPRRWLRGSSTANAADRFRKELEEEIGAVCVSRAAETQSAGKLLPHFWTGSYEEALKAAQNELKVLCVMIMDEEHGDSMVFRRTVMTNPELLDALTENDFIVWAGDIRDRDAHSTATKLGATAYPFVAFVSVFNCSQSGTKTLSSSPQLIVLSRHEGSPHDTTSAAALHAHITTAIIPNVSPVVTHLRAERTIREQDRQLREEQDRAFREAERRDGERFRVLTEEEEERKREEAEKARAVRATRELEEKNMLWRRWARRNLVPPEDPTAPSIRLRITLPNGRRVIRAFSPKHQVEGLFAFVDSHLIPEEYPPSQDPESLPEGLKYDWGFRVTGYPRVQVHCVKNQEIGDVTVIKSGVNLNVEMLSTEDSGSEWEED